MYPALAISFFATLIASAALAQTEPRVSDEWLVKMVDACVEMTTAENEAVLPPHIGDLKDEDAAKATETLTRLLSAEFAGFALARPTSYADHVSLPNENGQRRAELIMAGYKPDYPYYDKVRVVTADEMALVHAAYDEIPPRAVCEAFRLGHLSVDDARIAADHLLGDQAVCRPPWYLTTQSARFECDHASPDRNVTFAVYITEAATSKNGVSVPPTISLKMMYQAPEN